MENHTIKLLYVDDNRIDQLGFDRFAKEQRLPYEIAYAGSIAEGWDRMETNWFDVVLLDYSLGDGTAFDLLGRQPAGTAVIVVTGNGNEEIAVQAMKYGASDYLIKDSEGYWLKTVPVTVENAIKLRDAQEALGKAHQELKQALKETEESRQRIDAILRSVNEGLIVTDNRNVIVLMNEGAEQLLGFDAGGAIGQHVAAIAGGLTFVEKLDQLLEEGESGLSFDFEVHDKNPEAERKIIRGRSSVVKDKSGYQSGVVTIIYDVTAERTVERLKTEFVSTAAHELKTPLTTIQGFSELLLTGENIRPDEQKKYLSFISEEADTLCRLVDDLLDIARIDANQQISLDLSNCDVYGFVETLIESFSHRFPAHQFEMLLPEDRITLKLDQGKIKQVFDNILGNAVKYSPSGGVIRVTCDRTDGFFVFRVEDQGIGMTAQQLNRIFDRFYRGDASNTAAPGSGLGMTIVKHIVEAHGGRVSVESQYGVGTVVQFTVPATS